MSCAAPLQWSASGCVRKKPLDPKHAVSFEIARSKLAALVLHTAAVNHARLAVCRVNQTLPLPHIKRREREARAAVIKRRKPHTKRKRDGKCTQASKTHAAFSAANRSPIPRRRKIPPRPQHTDCPEKPRCKEAARTRRSRQAPAAPHCPISQPEPSPMGRQMQDAAAVASPAEKIRLISHRQSAFVTKPDTDTTPK